MSKAYKSLTALSLFLFLGLGVLFVHPLALNRSGLTRIKSTKIHGSRVSKIAHEEGGAFRRADLFKASGDMLVEDEDLPKLARDLPTENGTPIASLQKSGEAPSSRVVSTPKVPLHIFQLVLNL